MTEIAPTLRSQVRELDITTLRALVERVQAELVPALEELISKLDAAGAADGELQFGGLVKAAQKLLELDDAEMALTLKVSRPTINRWIHDKTSPHPVTRKAMCDSLAKRARSRIRLFQD